MTRILIFALIFPSGLVLGQCRTAPCQVPARHCPPSQPFIHHTSRHADKQQVVVAYVLLPAALLQYPSLIAASGQVVGLPPHAPQTLQPDDGPPIVRLESGGPPLAASISLDAQVMPILSNRCAACHSGAGRGGVSLFPQAGRYGPNVAKPQIADAVLSGRMPRGGPRLSANETDLIRQWSSQ